MGSAPTSSGSEIEDIGQITAAVIGHLRANPETQKRTDNVIQVFLGGAIAQLEQNKDKKSSFEEDDEGAPPEAKGLANYLENKKKELLESGYTPQQAEMILMGQLGALSVYTAIANSEKKISIVRRVMAHQVRKNAAPEQEQAQSKPSTSLGRTSASARDRARFAMRGQGHRGRS
jgi:hypothetical protein